MEASSPTTESPPTNPVPVVTSPADRAGHVALREAGVASPAEPPPAPALPPPGPQQPPAPPSRTGPVLVVWWRSAPEPPPPDPVRVIDSPADSLPVPVLGPRTDPIPVQGHGPNTDPIPVQRTSRRARTVILGVVVSVALLAVPLVLIRAAQGGAFGGGGHRVAVAAAGVDTAVLNVVTGAETLTIVSTGVPGGDLAVASTPAQSRGVPVLVRDGSRLTASTRDDVDERAGPVELTVGLARGVRWTVIVDGGARRLTLDLSQGQVDSVDINGGVGTIQARLPRPAGELTTRIGGGAGAVEVHLPVAVPARATFAAGAGTATLDDEYLDGVAIGATMTSGEWDGADDRIALAFDSGVGSATVDRSG